MKIVSAQQLMEIQLKKLKLLEQTKYRDEGAWDEYRKLREELDNNRFYRKKMDELFYNVNKHLKNK